MLNKAIISGIVAFLFFQTVDINWSFYLIIFLATWFLIGINFSCYKNLSLYQSLITINIAVFIGYCVNNGIKNGSITQSFLDKVFFFIVIGVILVIGSIVFMIRLKRQNEKNIGVSLINKREKDLILLLNYLGNFNIIGLNGRWGTGKTFLLNKLKERIQDEYEFIEIDLMTSNLNEMQPTLIKAFEEVMYKNRVLPKYANKMKNNVVSSSIVSKIQELTNLIFTNSNSKSEVLHGFQKELEKIDKKILVIYEDIDRISNKDVIKEIFSISEKISNEKIKIIYQYDENIMEEELGFNTLYLEKYIPFKMNITELHFWEVLQFELQDIDESVLSFKDFNFIRLPNNQFNVLNDFFELREDYTIDINYTPIRKVKHMIAEILMTLQMKKDVYINYKDTVISFYILKHLYSEAYKRLDVRESLLETLEFKVDDKDYTIHGLIKLFNSGGITKEKIKDAFNLEHNQENYALLKMFKFKILNEKKYNTQVKFKDLEEKAKHHNEKIDRIIWNLLYEGKSMFTDFEFAANKFNELVLNKPLSKQKEAFQHFWEYLFYSDGHVIDNITIFKIGHSKLLELFKCFKVINIDNSKQIKLIEFYFEHNDIKEFNLDVVKCMNYSPLKSTKEYLTILKYLGSLQIAGNFNKEGEFTFFLDKYIHALTRLSYIHSYKYFGDIGDFITDRDFMLNQLDRLLEDLKKVKFRHNQFLLSSTVEDLIIIIDFIEKIIEIFKCEEEIVIESGPFVSTEITSKTRNQEELDRLRQLFKLETNHNIVEEIEASYRQNKISLYEINILLQEKDTNLTSK